MSTIGSAIRSEFREKSFTASPRFAPGSEARPSVEQGCPALPPRSIQAFALVRCPSQLAMLDLERVHGRLRNKVVPGLLRDPLRVSF